jgi:phosphatidylglycerophosphate synthase
MREQAIEKQYQWRGNIYRRAANLICKSRIAAAPVVFGYAVLNPDYPSWKFGLAMGALQASDKIDGLLSRRGAKHLGESTTADGARLDQLSDKALFHGTLGGLAVRELMNSNIALGTVYAGNQFIAGIRDWKVNRWRRTGEEEGIDVKARPAGKIKTLVYGLALTTACSPLVESVTGQETPIGKYIVSGSLTAGTALAVWSGIDNIRNIREQRKPQESFTISEPPFEASVI